MIIKIKKFSGEDFPKRQNFVHFNLLTFPNLLSLFSTQNEAGGKFPWLIPRKKKTK